MIVNAKRYVAHFDMLGFKSATCRNPDEAWGALSDLRKCMDQMLNKHIEIISTNTRIKDRILSYIFSDSILIFTLSETPEDFASILVLTSDLFSCSLKNCIPLRGGISFGDFFFNDKLHLFCGIPFVRAYELSEMAQWSGIVVDDIVYANYGSLDSASINSLKSDGSPPIIKWDVSLKGNGKKSCWVVNWPYIYRKSFKKTPPISIADYYEAFESLFGPYSDLAIDVKTKYENTVEFINSSLSGRV